MNSSRIYYSYLLQNLIIKSLFQDFQTISLSNSAKRVDDNYIRAKIFFVDRLCENVSLRCLLMLLRFHFEKQIDWHSSRYMISRHLTVT